MRLRSSWIGLVVLLVGVLRFGSASSQPPPDAPRVLEAIEATERRIEQAESLAGDVPAPQVAGEIRVARDLQGRARNDYGGGQYAMAGRATMDARGHADRAIAILKGLPDPERVELQIERTRDGLDRARERLEGCQEPRVSAMLRVAGDMQNRAETALQESRYLAALQLTMSSRERIRKALRVCQIEESMQESASRALQRTDEGLARASEALEFAEDPIARQGLRRAEATQSEAYSEFRNSRFEPALKLTQAARVGAHRVLRRSSGPPAPPRR